MAESQEVEAQWRLELKELPTLQRLGRGLSGYLYETTWGGKKCARKDFPLGSAERNSLFETEVKKICKLDDHPNIVKCFGYTVGRNSCSLVQEYVADNLQNSVQRRIDQEVIRKKGTGSSRVLDVDEIKRLLSSRGKEKEKGKREVAGSGTFEAVPEAVGIISQIATGMRFLHYNGVVHGDLKPRNVLLLISESGEWKVKLADYGLTETKKRIRMVSERTRRAEILTWKAPECLGKKYVNHDDPFSESDTDSDEETVDEFFKSKLAVADVYSFGLTCSYVLGGKLMSPDMSLTQVRQQRMQGFKPKLPESASLEYLKFMIDSCLQPEPLKRPTFSAICTCLGLNDCGISLPSEVGLPSSLEDRSVDSPEQINTMSALSEAPREVSHSTITSCSTRETSSHESLEIIQLEDGTTTKSRETEIGRMLPERGNQDQQWSSSTKHSSSLFDVVGVTSMAMHGPFKPWRKHVQISAPFLRKNDRTNQELPRRCIDMVRQIPNFQKMQHSVLSSSSKAVETQTGIAHSPSDEAMHLHHQLSAESERRKKLADRFNVLRSLVPTRSKALDKFSILDDAITNIKDLQERTEELEASRGEAERRFETVQESCKVPEFTMKELEQRNSILVQPLALYHRGVAVRMLEDYLQDLKVLNSRQVEDWPEDVRQPRLHTVKKRIEEYQVALAEMQEVNLREPDGALKWQERDMLKRMLEDYSRGLEEFLDSPEDYGGRDSIEDQRADVRARIGMVDGGMPLEFSETHFDVMTESLDESLAGCEGLTLECTQLQSTGFQIFNLQCDFLVATLVPSVTEQLGRYKITLDLVKNVKVEEYEVSRRQRIFNIVAFCIESISELARQLQAVVDLLGKCCFDKRWITALELSNAPPKFAIARWSTFSLAIRACEWSMDIVELAFHALRHLLEGESTLLDVVFKWSDYNEQCRMVLEIDGKPVHRQEARGALLTVMRDLEAKDTEALIQGLVELAGRPRKFSVFDSAVLNMHGIASFLSQKLNGPIPCRNSLPWTFELASSTLKYSHFIDSGSSGMVAEYKWFGQKVAVKAVKSPGLSRKKFQEEAAILATVQHPFVVRMIGCAFETKNETGLLAMELMEHDLHSVILKRLQPGRSPFPLIVAIDIMLQIAEGMRYLQDHNILHRGLKAKNVLLNRCRRVRRSLSSANRRFPDLASLLHTEEYYLAKLADFGIAKDHINSSMTMMVGTTPWRAPEVLNASDLGTANHYTWRADVYSFAITCFEILTGKLPFEGVPNNKIYESIMAGVRPPLEGVEMPPTLKSLIDQCWATNPVERPSFAEICQTLWQCKVEIILPLFRLHISPSRRRSL